jgi:hypothetical protein
MDKETQEDTMQRIQKKDNAPCNNQLKRIKRKEDKKKVTFHQENCLPKSAPKEQEAKESPPLKKQLNPQRLSQKISPPPLKPMNSPSTA